ncbi:uncharacterized protein LOC100279061 [Zea mays]|jgi:hypothetical protein|uniref:Uncharacterized protein n=3 Tax=Zea mays TaxID=4577 RepID=A0A804QDM8_MAIZE|nr:uncharacterized protein LOC100279061 [Zea mays]|eukprot:NP_001314860.1 uncharacterized protein LOC100279061 [Zea mays]
MRSICVRRLKSAYHPPSPPPQHAEFSYCWLLLAIADHTHSSLPPPRHRKLARCLQASPTAAIYTHTSARRARAARNQNSGCWRARGPGKEQGRAGSSMVFFCFLVEQRRTVRSSKPAAGICSRCGGCASVADMETATRVCYLLTVHRRTWRAIICTFCGAMLKSYRHYRLY